MKNEIKDDDFFIVNSNTQPIVRLESCVNLNLVLKVDSVENLNLNKYSHLINEYKNLFLEVDIDKNATAVVYPVRKSSITFTGYVKRYFNRFRYKVIQTVEGSSKRVNVLVIVKKTNNKLKICLDAVDLNKVIKREY